ncbi:MAG TPA: CPBP family intramembrane metalloprotease [Nitrospiria bacterium]|nr:CPBP family intramembrane metalloprotease [Candidatus Manganitrophaceae bacterium]HIL35761.1 CPBP family intramembrane metalloprotease [Candidatus Manganitrophaceae bacterium]
MAVHDGIFLAGILYAYIYERTESLMPVILAHAIQNLSTVLNYFNYRAVNSIADLKSAFGWTAFLLTSIFLTLEIIYRAMLKRGHTLTGTPGKTSR